MNEEIESFHGASIFSSSSFRANKVKSGGKKRRRDAEPEHDNQTIAKQNKSVKTYIAFIFILHFLIVVADLTP